MNKYFGSPIKKIAWGLVACAILGLVIMVGMYISKENQITEAIEDSKGYVDKIKGCVSSIDSTLSSADYVFGSFASDDAVDNVTDDLWDISLYMEWIDSDYKEDVRVADAIESYVEFKTSCASWEEYKTYINEKYFVADSNEASAEKLVKGASYSSNAEMAEARRNSSVIVESLNHSSSGSNYKVYGTVTNNTSYTVKFVKVKVSMKDADGKVIDTETTYACGGEGLKPGESTKFDCYIKKDSKAKNFSAEIYEYD